MNRNDPQFYAGDFKAPDPKGRSLSLEDTSEFTRPAWASNRDLPVGQDELGNTIFQGAGGRTYTAKPNPMYGQQRPEGGFIRAGLDAIPPMEDWSLEGAGSAFARGAKAIGEVLWDVIDTPRQVVAGERTPTIGDAVDVAGFSATGGLAGFSVPEGALRANIPMFRRKASGASTKPEPTTPTTDPFDEPINWAEVNATPPDEGFNRITHRDWHNYQENDFLVDEFLMEMGIDPTPSNINFANAQMDNGRLAETNMSRFFSEGLDDDFIQGDGLIRSNPPEIAQFRSPVREVVDDIEIPSKGLKGSQFLKELQDNPTIRNSEVAAMDLQIDPMKRYTREELAALVDENAFTVEALGAGPRHRSMQRQDVLDPEIDYEEIVINASRGEGKPMFEPKHGHTHYDPNTVAHARVSVRQGDQRNYLLVEEMQSDLLQQGYKPPRQRGQGGWEEPLRELAGVYDAPWAAPELRSAYRALYDSKDPTTILPDTIKQLRNPFISRDISKIDATEIRKFLRSHNVPDPEGTVNPFAEYSQTTERSVGRRFAKKVEDFFSDSPPQEIGNEFLNEEIFPFVRFLESNYGVDIDDWLLLDSKPNFFNWLVNHVNSKPTSTEHAFLEELLNATKAANRVDPAVGAPPVTSTTESTRALVQSLMSYAERQGVNEIVFPPLERIAAQRFQVGTEGYQKAIKPGSGFHQTYVTSLNKVLKGLEKELGPDTVQVGQRPINYEVDSSRFGVSSEVLPQEDFQSYARWAQEEGVSIREIMPEDLVRQLDYENGVGWDKDFVSLPTEGISIRLQNVQDLDLSRPRFHKGGLVTRTKQALGEL